MLASKFAVVLLVSAVALFAVTIARESSRENDGELKEQILKNNVNLASLLRRTALATLTEAHDGTKRLTDKYQPRRYTKLELEIAAESARHFLETKRPREFVTDSQGYHEKYDYKMNEMVTHSVDKSDASIGIENDSPSAEAVVA